MKGSTHLAIGALIGAAFAVYHRMDFAAGALTVSVATFSALGADLDGQSLLSGKLSRTSRFIRDSIFALGIVLLGWAGLRYAVAGRIPPELAGSGGSVILLGFAARVGLIRNILLSLIGASLAGWGWLGGMVWLAGLGLFVGAAPWLKHRGLTHTVWALLYWSAIGWGLERQLQIPGIAAAAAGGYFSHLAADTLTPQGVKWLFPLSRTALRLPFR
jgi:inner membrane protein